MSFNLRCTVGACLVVGAVFAALPAWAKVVSMKQTGRQTLITLPDSWPVTQIKGGIEVKSADGEVFIWVQASDGASVKRLIDEYFTYYKKQGVTFNGKPVETTVEVAGAPVAILQPPATFEGQPTVVRFVISDAKPDAQKGLLIGYWASEEGDVMHDQAITRMMEDLLR